MKEIIINDVVLARHISKEDIKNGLNFFSKDNEFIQVGVWGNYEKGKDLLAHAHNQFDRITNRTYETLYVINGSIEASIYDFSNNLIEKLIIPQGDILVLLECAHGYKILEDNTTVLEVKNGPYYGAEKDRRRI